MCAAFGTTTVTVQACSTARLVQKLCLPGTEGGRTEGAKAKGEGESKARTAMGGAERLDAVRLVAAAIFWCCGTLDSAQALHILAFVCMCFSPVSICLCLANANGRW